MEQQVASLSQRLSSLDLFRGTFLLIMLEGHTFRALLDPSLKAGAVYRYQDLVHNLPGPAFLFVSGFAFSLTTLAHWDTYRRWSGRLRGRLLRLLFVLLLGYALQLTYFSLRRSLAETTPAQLSFLLSMNILQCIAISVLLLQLLVLVLPGQDWVFRAVLASTVLVGLLTPSAWSLSPEVPLWLRTNLGGKWGSPFPLFPYFGFATAGAAWGYLFARARQEGKEALFLRRSRRFWGWLAFGSLAVSLLPLPEIYSDFWYTSPTFLFLRVALLGWLLGAFRFAETRLLPSLALVVLFGKETLSVYVAHLLLLYGSAWNPDRNLRKLLGNQQSPGEAALVLLLLFGAMLCLAWGWNRLKEGYRRPARGLQWGLAGYLVYTFVSG